ncbi:23S rRNA Um-2552 2'-O-methyltransferase [Limimonas halophila]|uniref:Ribosomal RNA large subunit methyltransferase E n=1 Tax=Limimonas halophila TaxID=1082479 RepID=A0A1G7MC88_9PROT|nr:RlmE family RNA methyltransferase [Limimonas halophila]SDF59256.1 23S rRNA Um-2552 2'-O-methyltransferase [Limimonas halophila]
MSGNDRIRRQRRRTRQPHGGGERIRAKGGRTSGSRQWLERHLNDPYVAAAQREGYRARAAFKLLELDDKFGFLRRGGRVLDLGAAPGSWCQVARERVGGKGVVIGLDLLEVEPLAGATLIQGDVYDPEMPQRLREALGGAADVVLSDMAPNTTGHKRTDRLRVEAVAEAALDLAESVLAPGGAFVAKLYQTGGSDAVTDRLKHGFDRVRHMKPPASRGESPEVYVVATGFRPAASEDETPDPDTVR